MRTHACVYVHVRACLQVPDGGLEAQLADRVRAYNLLHADFIVRGAEVEELRCVSHALPWPWRWAGSGGRTIGPVRSSQHFQGSRSASRSKVLCDDRVEHSSKDVFLKGGNGGKATQVLFVDSFHMVQQ